MHVYCADIGSVTRENFGWACIDGNKVNDNNSAQTLVEAVNKSIEEGHRVALGFECPLFVPVAYEPTFLGRRRCGEDARPWSAAAGATVLATGLVQVAWVLAHIRGSDIWTFDDGAFRRKEKRILLWEAFVSGEAKQNEHIKDALSGAKAFLEWFNDRGQTDESHVKSLITVPTGQRALSLIGACILWADWSQDPSIVRQPCAAIKAARSDAL